MINKWKRHPYSFGIMFSLLAGFLFCLLQNFAEGMHYFYLDDFLVGTVLYGLFVILPALLILANVVSLFYVMKDDQWKKNFRGFEWISIVLGVLYSFLVTGMMNIVFRADWEKVLVNAQVHTPVWTKAQPTVFVLTLLAVCGYLILSTMKLSRLSPLVIVLSMAAMYIGILICIVWTIQIIGMVTDAWILCILPFNCVVIALKTIRYKMIEWNAEYKERGASGKNRMISFLNRELRKAERWPVAALIFMIPLLGIAIGVLVLFGQEPDAVIRAWTETSDWRLSEKIAPQNIYKDEHYLCTVAAGGHRKVVKPVRMGERHGHPVVVNRQLCIANAFEQILEERAPGFHRHIRHFYDTFGFPVAKLVRTRFAADTVYFLMKPLEWIFLAVIYACDKKPENRIAVQYLPKCERNRENFIKS